MSVINIVALIGPTLIGLLFMGLWWLVFCREKKKPILMQKCQSSFSPPKYTCPSCGDEYDDTGHCKCSPLYMTDIDAAMQKQRQKEVKVSKYRSIDDAWEFNGGKMISLVHI